MSLTKSITDDAALKRFGDQSYVVGYVQRLSRTLASMSDTLLPKLLSGGDTLNGSKIITTP
jgi:hypothetical protein